jgi:hypothetical protein
MPERKLIIEKYLTTIKRCSKVYKLRKNNFLIPERNSIIQIERQ